MVNCIDAIPRPGAGLPRHRGPSWIVTRSVVGRCGLGRPSPGAVLRALALVL